MTDTTTVDPQALLAEILLTPEGKAQLRAEAGTWRQYAAAVFRVIDARQAEG